jgi:glycosyltransferase involved in cell wall biosynthesis
VAANPTVTAMAPRTVFGLPAYNRPDALAETLESILGQTCGDFALVICDDSTSDATASVVAPYLAADARIVYERNPRRIGMIENWRRCFERAAALFPGAEFFAWASDHDVWHPRWLEALVAELDAHPGVVLAYPLTLRTFADSRPVVNRPFDTKGMSRPADRLRAASLRMMAGNMIYGLFRRQALADAGVFARVLVPDRQVLLELSLVGEFSQVPELLWYREIAKGFSLDRQRTALFADGAPLYTYVPTDVTHAVLLFWHLAVTRRAGRGGLAGAVGYPLLQLWTSFQRDARVLIKHAIEDRLGWVWRPRAPAAPNELAAPSSGIER